MRFLALLLIILMLLVGQPVKTETQKPFLAVFTSKDFVNVWYRQKPDLLFQGKDFKQLDDFLALVKLKAGKRPILLDFDIHGNAFDGFLSIDDQGSDECSTGYLIKRIDQILKHKKLTVFLEACHARITIERTLRSKLTLETPDLHIEGYEGYPKFPIYGVGRTAGWDNVIYLQYKYNIRLFFEDERDFIDKPAEKSDPAEEKVRILDVMLQHFRP